MKIRISITLLLLFSHSIVFAQNFSSADPAYVKNVQLGEKSLLEQKYDSCLVYYETAFKIKQTSVLSTLRMAACAYGGGKVGKYEEQMDKAFELEPESVEGIFNSYEEFEFLKNTSFSEEIEKRWKKVAMDLGLDLKLMNEFDLIAESDQAQRREMRSIEAKYGWNSPQMDSLWKLQSYSDSVNTVRISEILDKDGYPGKSRVGARHQGTAFLVIQHAELEMQEKYLPLIKAAADAGEVRWSSVALLVDRVRERQGKRQIYGSQVTKDFETNEYYFEEIEEPYKVDSIRATVGLGPLNDYAKNWNFSYDPDKHVERHRTKEKKE